MTQGKFKRWTASRWILLLAAGGLSSSVGCAAPRVVLVPPGQLVRLGPNCRGQVYVRTSEGDSGQWTLSRNQVTLPEGWYAGPPPEQ